MMAYPDKKYNCEPNVHVPIVQGHNQTWQAGTNPTCNTFGQINSEFFGSVV